jgi:hypothetical protein
VTIISTIFCPVIVMRLMAEFPPTFTVWQRNDPAVRATIGDSDAGRRSSLLPEPSIVDRVGTIVEFRVGVGEDVTVGIGVDVTIGVGEDVTVGIGEDVTIGVGVGVTVGVGEVEISGVGVEVKVGVGEVVGTVVSSGAATVTYPGRPRVLATLKF